MVLICKGINQRSNINTYRNNLIKYNRVVPANIINQINVPVYENNMTQINTTEMNTLNYLYERKITNHYFF